MLYYVGAMISAGLTADNVYEVLPDGERCVQHPCLYLNYLIDNHQAYFTSNTTIMFSEAQYRITGNNMIIQNVSNFSLLSASYFKIVCSPKKFLLFHNVVNLTIKNMTFSECGNSLNNGSHWASMVFNECTNVLLTDVHISNPVGYGIIAYNMFGYNILENISVYMGRQKSLYNSSLTCSYGVHISYLNSEGMETGKNNATVIISNIEISLISTSPDNRSCSSCCGLNYYQRFTGMFEIYLKQNHYNVFITIENSRFSYLIGNIFMINAESLANNRISFDDCKFTNISNYKETKDKAINNEKFSQYVLGFYYRINCNDYWKHLNLKFQVSFVDCDFRNNTYSKKFKNDHILHIEAAIINCNQNRPIMLITFRNVTFKNNKFGILTVTSSVLPISFEPYNIISIITEDEFHIQGNLKTNELIYLNNVQMHFNGITRFVENHFLLNIINSDSSKLIFTNTTIFHENKCYYLLKLNGKWLHISLAEHAKFTVSSNVLDKEIISVSKVFNNPFPYCIIQLNSDFYQNFSINIFNNTERSVDSNRSNSTINKLTSHCKLNVGRKYCEDPLVIYKQIINYKQKYQPLGIHTDICHCPANASHNCSVDWLGKVYPGQTLTVDLCLPYNNEENSLRILCVESYNDYLPPNACKVYSQLESKHVVFGKQSIKVNFSIASNHSTRCELFLTAQPDLYVHYDTFNIQIVPCPLGFALRNDICDCDPQLGPYTEECVINYQVVKRLPNCWISGNTGENSTKYYVANRCPVFYCSQTATFINVQQPDTQCRQHRGGMLCSQCKPGYSLVLGSSKCKKCSNVHLTFITLLIFNGLLLFAVIFILNLTVTVGTFNPLILYINIIQINDFSLHLQSRLIKPLYIYAAIVNLGLYFEMCVYDGMNIYAKKWIHIAYPMYLVLIACLFILASRYSNKLFRLTHKRSLPVVATLFVLIYTNELQSISSAFLFTTITSLPSMQFRVVWYLDPNIKLYGWKYLLLFMVCLILLMILLILNAILLFTRTLMRFRVIHRLKPIIDALQGPFKSQYYYWMGIHLLIRNAMLLISNLEKDLSITVECIIVLIGVIVQSYLQPYKNIITNFQEVLLLCNYIILSVLLLFNGGELFNIIVLNVMIGLSFLQFMLLIVYHIYAFAFIHHCIKVQDATRGVWTKIRTLCWNRRQNDHNNEITELQIPKVSFNYSEFQEPLLGLD